VNDVNSTYSLKDGHYKATLDNKFGLDPGNKAKSKVFWVDCPEVKPTLTTEVSKTDVQSGDKVHDTATLVGDFNHGVVTGTVDFYLCGPAAQAPDCSAGGKTVGDTVTVANGQAVSANVTIDDTTETGTYCFRASYHAPRDSNYKSVTHTNKTTECFTVTKKPVSATPSVSVEVIPCTPKSGKTDNVKITVTNTDDDTNAAVTYTVTVGNQSKTITLNDGASGSVTFTGLAAGQYSVQVAGDDNTSANAETTVEECPCPPKRDTGFIKVIKHLKPYNDNGRFNLNIDGKTKAWKVGNNGTTGLVKVYVGEHGVSETAGNYWTQLDKYKTSYYCWYNTKVQFHFGKGFSFANPYQNPQYAYQGWGTSISGLQVGKNQTLICVFENIRKHEDKPVTPPAVTSTPPTCEDQTGTYTIPETKGVQYKVDGVVTPADSYQVPAGTTVTVTAEALPGYVLAHDVVTSWTLSFPAAEDCEETPPPVECVLPAVKDDQGNCIVPGRGGDEETPQTPTKPVKVIAPAAELTNTGESTLLSVLLSSMFLIGALTLALVPKKQ
jgi:hypothetical protein